MSVDVLKLAILMRGVLTSTSPSALMCVVALKYVRTALRLGVVAGMKRRKSLGKC
jgi:hypothetical protein